MNALNTDNAVAVSMRDAITLILGTGGKFFRVDFNKRTNGAPRQMVARLNVKSANPGGGRKFDPASRGLIPVWEPALFTGADIAGDDREHDDRYRMIPVEGITAFKVGGVTYRVRRSA